MFRRSFLAALTSAALVTAMASPAAAIDQREGRAEATAISFAAFGQEPLSLTVGASDAAVGPTNLTASATALSLIADPGASVDITSGSARDPEDGDGCLTPASPLEGLSGGLFCTVAAADASDPSANGTATLGALGLEGGLVPALLDAIVGPIADALLPALDDGTQALADGASAITEPVIAGLQGPCFQALEGVDGGSQPVDDAIAALGENAPDQLAEPVGVLVEAFTENELADACVALFSLVTDPPSAELLVDDVRALVRDALEGVPLLTLAAGTSSSAVGPDGADWTADADAATLTVTLPPLGAVVDAVDTLVEGALQLVVDDVVERVTGLGVDVPGVQDVIDPVLAEFPLPAILQSTSPLLVLTVLPGTASVVVPSSGETVREAAAAVVRLTVADEFAELFGQDGLDVSVSPGDGVTLFEGTPLESTLASGVVEEFDETSGSITLAGVRTAAADIALLTGIEGGIEITAGAVEAVAGVGSFTAGGPDPERELPVGSTM